MPAVLGQMAKMSAVSAQCLTEMPTLIGVIIMLLAASTVQVTLCCSGDTISFSIMVSYCIIGLLGAFKHIVILMSASLAIFILH